ncbi:MAG: ATP-dependent RNA helicase HrpA, partial [Deltaproteobacteria bacterium]|nr:ATP-dependent RNA helicase HrpA [Deltaproteobacteria bacterium]
MLRDRSMISAELKKIQREAGKAEQNQGLSQMLSSLEKKLGSSIRKRSRRMSGAPEVSFPSNLPISEKADEIIQAIKENQVLIIAGDTGSGKSTQIPKMCLAAGRGIAGMIGCTQPRRIAANSIARRIAEEIGEDVGGSVGYKIRFMDRSSRDGYIKIMTDGMLLAETQEDPKLYGYDTIIIDEAHERSLNIDFLIGIVRNLLKKRKELKVIVTSATMDTEKFSEGFFKAPVITVHGRVFPVETRYMPPDPKLEERGDITYVDSAVKTVERLIKESSSGDILVFMPTEQDILETCDILKSSDLSGTLILPLFARLSSRQQRRVFASGPGRKIVVATNVAETSLTIPGIRYVIDTGLARISRYLPRSRITSLPISPISRSSADQRMGRCGRLAEGICVRLYPEKDYETRPRFTPPEILRSNLAEVIMRMISLDLGDVRAFPFLDSPGQKSIKDGFDLLRELGATERDGRRVSLTKTGRVMARMPLDPKISRMLIEAKKEDCIREVTIIASALSIQDPRVRPIDQAEAADRKHAAFKDPDSDFITLLNIWNRYSLALDDLKTQNRVRRYCRDNFLSYVRMREWRHIHSQISTILKEQKTRANKAVKNRRSPPL